MGQSDKWHLTKSDVLRWVKNTLIFFSPVVIIYLVSVQTALNDGFSWQDFQITTFVLGSIMTWLVSTLLDFFRKLASGPQMG